LLDLSNFTNINVSFNHYYRHVSSTATLLYSIDGGVTWEEPIQQWSATTANPATFDQVITAVNGQSQVRFKWNYTGSYGYYWNIDDIVITGDEITDDPEPTNHASNFVVDGVVNTSIALTWTDAVGTQLPAGYLVKASAIGYTDITAPVNGTPETERRRPPRRPLPVALVRPEERRCR
jgi:hypothetical protein